MKRLFLFCLTLLLSLPLEAKRPSHPHMYAHRGCWSKDNNGEWIIPENSVAAVAAAAKYGYEGIECDVHYTKDKRMVILHDATLNRTARRASDYSKLETPIYLKDLTFEELRRDYVLESTNPELRTPIPTLEELLAECKMQNIKPMLHSDIWESYKVAQDMFGNDWICFTGGVERMQKVRAFSDCTILLAINDGTAEQNIARLSQIGGHCGISTMNYSLYTPEFCKAITDAGYEVQASIFPAPHEAIAQRNGITYQLTDFSFMPPAGKKPKYVYKVRMTPVGVFLANLRPQNKRFRRKTKELIAFGVVVEITSRNNVVGNIDAKINSKEYKFRTNSKEKIYLGARMATSNDMKLSVKSNSRNYNNKRKSNIKQVRYMAYDM